MRYCEKCGTPNADNAKFCRKCGNKIKVSNGHLKYVILFVILIGGVLAFLFPYHNHVTYVANDVDTSIVDTVTSSDTITSTQSKKDFETVENTDFLEPKVDIGEVTCRYRNESNAVGGASIVLWVDVVNYYKMQNPIHYSIKIHFYDINETVPICDENGDLFELKKAITILDQLTIPYCFVINDKGVRRLMNCTDDLRARCEILLCDEKGEIVSSKSSLTLNLAQFTSGPDDY